MFQSHGNIAELNSMPRRQHVASVECWCVPRTTEVRVNGRTVIGIAVQHRNDS